MAEARAGRWRGAGAALPVALLHPEASARRAALRVAGPLPVALAAALLLTAPSVFDPNPHPSTALIGLDVGVAGALALGIAAIAVLDSVAHRDRRGVPNVLLGTALGVVILARAVIWGMAVDGHLSAAIAAEHDGWLLGTVELAMAPVLAWAALRPAQTARCGTGIPAAVARGLGFGGALVLASLAMDAVGEASLDHASDVVAVAGTVVALGVVVWSARHGAVVRSGTQAAIVMLGAAGLAQAVSKGPFDAYWYAAHAGILLGLACLFVGKARLLSAAMSSQNEHLGELRVLHGAAERLASTLDVAALREIVVELAAEALTPPGQATRRATLVRVDDGLFQVVAAHDGSGLPPPGAVFPQSSFPEWRQVVETRVPVAIDLDRAVLGPGAHAAVRRLGLRSQMVAPVIVDGVVSGLLTASLRVPHRFSATELAALSGIANLAGLAFDNAWRYADEHRLVETLYKLAAANTDAARAPDVDTVLEHVAHAAAQLTGARSADVVLLDEGGGAHVITTRAEERPLLERFAADLGAGLVAMPLPGRVTPFRIADVLGLAPPEVIAGLRASGVQSLLAVPLLRAATPAGVLYVAGRSEPPDSRDFGSNDEAVLVALAAHAMVAVENVQMMRRLAEASVVDPLTGLGNRREFERVRALRPRLGFAVLAIDVDNLKVINDEAGHEAGDAVLRAVGATLFHAARPDDRAMRVGGDEFCLVVHGAGLETGRDVGERIRTALAATAVPHGQARVSIGVAAGEPGDEVDAVWAVADHHLYRAKACGRDRLVTADTAAGPAPRWENVVRSAFAPGGLRTVFQPIVDLCDGTVTGFEALSRPLSTPPGESVEGFFAAAQRLGMMRDVDWLCRRTALESAARLPAGTPVFVNVSTGALLDPVLGVDQMELLAAAAGVDPSQLVLELTERELVPDLERLAQVLAEYRHAGFRFALDDVGAGRSTLALLVAGQPEFLKIAGNIVASAHSVAADGLLDAAVAFARRTGATVIAEGIEDEKLAARLLARGVRQGQGYGLFRPMEVAEAHRLAERGR